MLIDMHGREITYLRISLTPSCNLRCVYCMPPEGIPAPKPDGLLSNDEILSFMRQAASLGISNVRLTGGEPLLRKGLLELVRSISTIPGIDEISLTTNAMLLEKYASGLAEAGLSRINISLDTLNPEKFTQITRGGKIKKVFNGIAAAEDCGLTPIKINTVILGRQLPSSRSAVYLGPRNENPAFISGTPACRKTNRQWPCPLLSNTRCTRNSRFYLPCG